MRSVHWASMTIVSVVSAVLVFAFAGVLGYAVFVEPAWLRVRRVVIPVAGALADLNGLRILHLSDLHVGRANRRLAGFLRRAAAIDADVVVITGDFVETPESTGDLSNVLAPLVERQDRPLLAVLGNHDRFRYPHRWRRPSGDEVDASRLVIALQNLGMRVLVDESVVLPTRVGDVRFTGVDIWSHWRPGIIRALGGNDPTATILLAHSPDAIVGASAEGIPLVLVGHTHGGQVRLAPWFAPKRGTRLRIQPPAGLVRWAETWMHISPGLGTTVLPMRLFSRPEATVLELSLTDNGPKR